MALIVGLIIGFLMCIPIGPLNVLVINTQIKKSSTRALSIALGGSSMDLLYFYLILSGLSFITFSDTVVTSFKTVGIILIFVLGVKELLSQVNLTEFSEVKESPRGILAGLLLGVIIYTSNPTLIVTMTGLGTFVRSLELFIFSQTNIILVSVGLATGSFLWFVFLVKVVDRYQEKIRNKYLNYFTKVSGILMIGLALFMGYRQYA